MLAKNVMLWAVSKLIYPLGRCTPVLGQVRNDQKSNEKPGLRTDSQLVLKMKTL